jgi:hypothetical protein
MCSTCSSLPEPFFHHLHALLKNIQCTPLPWDYPSSLSWKGLHDFSHYTFPTLFPGTHSSHQNEPFIQQDAALIIHKLFHERSCFFALD